MTSPTSTATPSWCVADGLIGQMMEPIEWHDDPQPEAAAQGLGHHRQARTAAHTNIINSLYIDPDDCDAR